MTKRIMVVIAVVAPRAIQLAAQGQTVEGTTTTYQGQLTKGGAPYDGQCCFDVGLWDAWGGGNQISSWGICGHPVDQDRFTSPLDFGSYVSDGYSNTPPPVVSRLKRSKRQGRQS